MREVRTTILPQRRNICSYKYWKWQIKTKISEQNAQIYTGLYQAVGAKIRNSKKKISSN